MVSIAPCLPERVTDALALVLRDLTPEQRREISADNHDGLFVALRGEQLCGAAWGQRQPGNTALFWPPQLAASDSTDPDTAARLAQAVVAQLDATGVAMAQTLLPSHDDPIVPSIESAGFRHLVDLLYLTCESAHFPDAPPAHDKLEFQIYDESQRERLERLIERTYAGTLDCAALDGVRNIDDVLDGYRATGVYRPENWHTVRAAGADAGVLLLADHPQARHFELVYMGVAPEFRGRGWGLQITRYAQWLARKARVERIVLAVDATNRPALAMYQDAGFAAWDERAVFVRVGCNEGSKC